MRRLLSCLSLGMSALLFAAAPFSALGQDPAPAGEGQTTAQAQQTWPYDGQMSFNESVTPLMDSIVAFHNGLLLWAISIVVLVVLALMVWVVWRYNAKRNPVPARFTHNTAVEIIWTIGPILILIIIAIPSFGILADQMTIPDGERKYLGANIFSFGEVDVPAPELTIKATGYQWYWGYTYVDQEVGEFYSALQQYENAGEYTQFEPRLFAVDNEMVVPVDTTVRLQVTGGDVIHAFAMPSFGVKIDAVPGRLNEQWFNVRKTGIYYGQCSELCGHDHAYMPIGVRVVSKEQFATWMTALQSDGIEAANATLPPLVDAGVDNPAASQAAAAAEPGATAEPIANQ